MRFGLKKGSGSGLQSGIGRVAQSQARIQDFEMGGKFL